MRLRGGRQKDGQLDCGIALWVDSELSRLKDGPV